ncbi:hypothetical protein Dimus_032986 [Dionaea muscipula]
MEAGTGSNGQMTMMAAISGSGDGQATAVREDREARVDLVVFMGVVGKSGGVRECRFGLVVDDGVVVLGLLLVAAVTTMTKKESNSSATFIGNSSIAPPGCCS